MEKGVILKILILSLVIIFFLPFASFAQSNAIHIPLDDSHLNFDVIKDAKNLQYAPDYNANITIKILSDKVFRNDKVDFKIIVEDTGILKMKKPYYYVFVVDNGGTVVGTFPNPSGINQYYNSKWSSWQVVSKCDFRNKTKDTIYQKINEIDWYISRDALLSSGGWMYNVVGGYCHDSIENVIFTSKTNNVLGSWKVYVFVFDAEPYCTRLSDDSVSCYGDYSNKKVAWNYNEFQVIDQTNTASGGPKTTETLNNSDFFNNPWVITIIGGIIVSSIVYFLFGRKKGKKTSSEKTKTINQKQKGKEIYGGIQAEKINKVNININHNRKRRK